MLKNSTEELKLGLIADRNEILEKVKNLFNNSAIEAHIFGSIARGNSDAFSDIDIWFTFKDEDIEEILANRYEYYAQIGEILNICEPPQNAPINGVHTSVIYKTKAGYVTVDYMLCPESSAHITNESKKIFGIELPIKVLEYNPQKAQVNESYRIDFLIIFITVAVKKLLRGEENPLTQLFNQYKFLEERYNVSVEPLNNKEQTFGSLKDLIKKVEVVANEKQRKALDEIGTFIVKVETINFNS